MNTQYHFRHPGPRLRWGKFICATGALFLALFLTLPLMAQDDAPVDEETTTEVSPAFAEAVSPEFPLTLVDRLTELGGYPCSGEILTCVKLAVPYDHTDPDDERTLEVVFGVKPAAEESQGMLVVAVGGPGGAGIGDGAFYLESGRFGEELPNSLDLVFFDARGIGLSHPLECAAAADNYDDASYTMDPESPAGEAAMLAAARTFAEECAAEMNEPDLLPYLATRHAVEDLEYFLEQIDQKQIYLYGESYGTQYAQTFAAAHPERIAGLMLDGVVDLSLTGEQFYRTYVKVVYDNLLAVLRDCNKDQNCAADAGGDAVALLDRVVAAVARQPLTVTVPLPMGGSAERTLGQQELRVALASEPMSVLHALLAAGQDDYLPLLRLYYAYKGIDPLLNRPYYHPDTADTAPTMVSSSPTASTFTEAAYYNVDCADYEFFSGTPEERGRAYMAAGDLIEKEFPVYSDRFYADLPCVYWPTVGPGERPEPFTGGRYPTFIINGTGDTQTPVDNGYQIFDRLQNGYMITQRTGGHVQFDQGACPDKLLSDFMLYRILPGARQFVCPGSYLAGTYTPMLKRAIDDYPDPAQLIQAAAREIRIQSATTAQPDAWNSSALNSCAHGGVMGVSQAYGNIYMSLAGCEVVEGFALHGFGSITLDDSYDMVYALHAAIAGTGEGYFSYTQDGDSGPESLQGEYQGQPLLLQP